jgi:hypothetical protein
LTITPQALVDHLAAKSAKAVHRIQDIADDLRVSREEAEAVVVEAAAQGRVLLWPDLDSCLLSESEAAARGWTLRSADLPDEESPEFWLYWAPGWHDDGWLPNRLSHGRYSWDQLGRRQSDVRIEFHYDDTESEDAGFLERHAVSTVDHTICAEIEDEDIDILVSLMCEKDEFRERLAQGLLPRTNNARVRLLSREASEYNPAIARLRNAVTAKLVGTSAPGWTRCHETPEGDLRSPCLVCGNKPLETAAICMGCLRTDPRLSRITGPGNFLATSA